MNDNLQQNEWGNEFGSTIDTRESDVALTRFMSGVYVKMFLALLISAGAAWVTAHSSELLGLIFGNGFGYMGFAIVELVLVWLIAGKVYSYSSSTLNILFIIYSILNGAMLASIFLVYSLDTVTTAFLATSLTFGGCSLVGYFVKKDLSTFGRILTYLLIGLVVASLVNIFFKSTGLSAVLTYVGVALFLGLTVYDTWKIKNAGYHLADDELQKRFIVAAALDLYLDFINLFLYILRILGRNRN